MHHRRVLFEQAVMRCGANKWVWEELTQEVKWLVG